MDVDMIIESLKESLQSLEDIKTEVAEEQEEIRKTIALIPAGISCPLRRQPLQGPG